MTKTAVTINVGGGPGNSAAREAAMTEWARRIAHDQPAIIFAQEALSNDWLEVWTATHNVTLGVDRGWRIRSALITHRSLSITPLTEADSPNLWYHGNYVAAARWDDAPGGPVTLASVHASPSLASPDAYGWTGARPEPRNGGGDPRYVGGRAWDADYLLSTLAAMARETPVLAVGDFNESRTDDFDEANRRRGTWGKEYFDRVEEVGFTDCVLRACREELPTRGRLQLDYVLASGRAAQLVIKDPKPQVDRTWSGPSAQDLSDHAALWFNLVDGL
jgi:hypothetical protein